MFVLLHLFFVRRREVRVTLARPLVCHVTWSVPSFPTFTSFCGSCFSVFFKVFVVVPGYIAGVEFSEYSLLCPKSSPTMAVTGNREVGFDSGEGA